jgi:hypothetical protein
VLHDLLHDVGELEPGFLGIERNRAEVAGDLALGRRRGWLSRGRLRGRTPVMNGGGSRGGLGQVRYRIFNSIRRD